MANYSFRETLGYFSEKLGSLPPEEDLEVGEVELEVDTLQVVLSEGKVTGSMHMRLVLGLILHPIREEKLRELATSNFLGINTCGCKLAFDESGISLNLHAYTTSGASPQENWEWLHRLLSVAREWIKVLNLWEEFVPVSSPPSNKEKKDVSEGRQRNAYRA